MENQCGVTQSGSACSGFGLRIPVTVPTLYRRQQTVLGIGISAKWGNQETNPVAWQQKELTSHARVLCICLYATGFLCILITRAFVTYIPVYIFFIFPLDQIVREILFLPCLFVSRFVRPSVRPLSTLTFA